MHIEDICAEKTLSICVWGIPVSNIGMVTGFCD